MSIPTPRDGELPPDPLPVEPLPDHDAFPKTLRTWCYGIGVVSGAFALTVPEPVQPYLIALSAAANALALGYNPNRGR